MSEEIKEKKDTDQDIVKLCKYFTKSEKVEIRIPLDKSNPDEKTIPVCINGYIFKLKRGENIKVPKEVKNILIEAQYI